MKTLMIFLLAISGMAQTKRIVDRDFVITELGVAGATAFDIASTQSALNRGCRELNPLLGERPSAARMTLTLGAIEGGFATIDYFIKRGGRRGWRILPIVRTAIHTGAGINNLRCGR